MSRIRIELTPEMIEAYDRAWDAAGEGDDAGDAGFNAILEVAAGQIERRLRAAFAASHGRRGLAMLDDALDVIEEAMEAPPLGYRRQGPEVLQIPGEVL